MSSVVTNGNGSWKLVATILIQTLVFGFAFGQVAEKVDNLDYRLGRIERLIDEGRLGGTEK